MRYTRRLEQQAESIKGRILFFIPRWLHWLVKKWVTGVAIHLAHYNMATTGESINKAYVSGFNKHRYTKTRTPGVFDADHNARLYVKELGWTQ